MLSINIIWNLCAIGRFFKGFRLESMTRLYVEFFMLLSSVRYCFYAWTVVMDHQNSFWRLNLKKRAAEAAPWTRYAELTSWRRTLVLLQDYGFCIALFGMLELGAFCCFWRREARKGKTMPGWRPASQQALPPSNRRLPSWFGWSVRLPVSWGTFETPFCSCCC